ncbi:MAG TPA: adenylosuccinate lyase family protein [Desulfobulbus sp.]|nr:adenylosuccinate lyase family protein [Desulfobulbus sp.]
MAMPVHPFDYQINPHVFSTPEFEALFDEKKVFQRWLDFEAALATAQGKYGIIPAEAAQEIRSKAKLELIDLDGVRAGYAKSRNSVVPLLGGLRRACSNNHGEYVHYGATTQDVLDTGEILALRETLSLLYRDLRTIERICLNLALKYRATPMAARSHGQQALPTTFGLKITTWSAEIHRHIKRIQHIHSTIGYGQLSGAVGTYAALGPQGLEVAAETMALLGLKHNALSWHTSRDIVAELAADFSLLVMTLAKIANEIFQLQKTEIGELQEPSIAGALASSTMPHKQNPVICQRVVALSKHVRGLAGTVMESMAHEHERDPRSLWAEWLAIPQLCIYTGNALHSMIDVLTGLTVRPERMLENLYRQKNLITTEWLLFQLSKHLGKTKSLEKLHALSSTAASEGDSLKEAVLADAEIGSLFSREELALLDHPEDYTGQAVKIVDLAIAEISSRRQGDPDALTTKTLFFN